MTEISIHQKQSRADGEDIVPLSIGGTKVNNSFENELARAIENAKSLFIEKCKDECGVAWLKFVLKFETARKAFCYTEGSNISFDLNYDFSEAFNEITNTKLSDVMPEENKDKMTVSKTRRLTLNKKMIIQICESALQSIVKNWKK